MMKNHAYARRVESHRQMKEHSLQLALAERYRALDAKEISPPIEIAVGDYVFYPYRGFCDMLEREDFQKLSQNQLRTLVAIADDILSMQHPELFEAFVNDDGIIVVDKYQPHVEYSLDIIYNDARSRVEELFPQVSYPQGIDRRAKVDDMLVRNDTAHEVAHHADFWMDMSQKQPRLDYLHSGSGLLAWIEGLDLLLYPEGVSHLIGKVREAEGYIPSQLLAEGYDPQKVDQMMRAEFFAIAGEYYYGSPQQFAGRSPLLEAYMTMVLGTDLEIQRLYIPFKEMERRRGLLRAAINSPIDALLEDKAGHFHALCERIVQEQKTKRGVGLSVEIESIAMEAVSKLVLRVRQTVQLSGSVSG